MFLDNKYTRWYNAIVEKAKSQHRTRKDGIYYESHHIIPKSMGGVVQVLLTGKEHYICHLLLCHMTTGQNKYKMINALIRMAYNKGKGQRRYTAKSYSLIRALIAEKNRDTLTGVPKTEQARNNMKGRSGTWKREEKHLKEMSIRRKGKYSGNLNPFFGKKHSEETKKRWSEKRKGKVTRGSTGMKWYNDGVKSTMQFENEVDRTIWKYEGMIRNVMAKKK